MENMNFLKSEYKKLEEIYVQACGQEELEEFRGELCDLVLRVWSEEPGYHEDYGQTLSVIFDGRVMDRGEIERKMEPVRGSKITVMPGFAAIHLAGLGKTFVSGLFTFLTDMSFVNGDCTMREASAIEMIRQTYASFCDRFIGCKQDDEPVTMERDYSDMSIFDLSNRLSPAGFSRTGSKPKAESSKKKGKLKPAAREEVSVNDTINEALDLIDRMTKAGLGEFGDLGKVPEAEDFAGKTEIPEGQAEEAKASAEAGALAEAKEAQEPEKTLDELLAEMDALVGLDAVKKDIHTMINFIRVCKLREERGMKAPELSHHMVFSGNPGTGKTTIARMLSSLYKAIGVLKKGQLVEVDRSGLIAGYQGQTAIKTAEVIQSALGGVLFIDEAYALVESDNDTYGKECIATILKAMEDHRDELIVIVAGYDNLMHKFIESNPGLKSRFNKYIHFPDYTGEEMEKIFLLQCRSNGYTLEAEAQELLRAVFNDMYDTRDDNFGNGRTVRNTFEKIINCQATRLASDTDITDEELALLTMEDVKAGLDMAPEEPEAGETQTAAPADSGESKKGEE